MNLLGMRVQDRSRVEGIRRGEQVPRAFGRAWMEPVMSTRRNRCCYTVGGATRIEDKYSEGLDRSSDPTQLPSPHRAAKVADRHRFFAPGYRRHRAAFQNIGDLNGVHHHETTPWPTAETW